MKNKWILLIGLLAFCAFFISSIVRESPLLLYIASSIPIFIVPFLPDLKTSQRLHPQRKGVDIVKFGGSAGKPDWLVVSFKPGTVYWTRKKTLVISYEDAPFVETVPTDDYTAALTVLKYDLRVRPKSGRISVSLANLSERVAGLPYTVNEVNRLVIPLGDATELEPANPPASVASRSVELQA
ncbi:hypothetical protein [Paenibacillus sp. GYB003]|jgi:hypothetical protein|uniref:hypothetical protein n=1 Tax=Paenibacillus sp. GYB003 TaxID=2994392 RepID=UPI002F96192A